MKLFGKHDPSKIKSGKNRFAFELVIWSFVVFLIAVIAIWNESMGTMEWFWLLTAGLLIFSFAELIQILHDIRSKLYNKDKEEDKE